MPNLEFPFPIGSSSDEVAFLFEFVNGYWNVFRSDGLTEVFYYVHTNEGQPITREWVAALRDEARGYFREIAAGRQPTIRPPLVRHTSRGIALIEGDFTGRVRRAAELLVRSKRRLRACQICEHFFYPNGREPFCHRCREGRIAHALKLEAAQARSRRFRERRDAVQKAGWIRDEKTRNRLTAQKNLSEADRLRLEEAEDRLARREREHCGSPPPPRALARWEIIIQIGVKSSDVQIHTGTAGLAGAFVDSSFDEEKEPTILSFSGTYAEILDEYRSVRLKGGRFIA